MGWGDVGGGGVKGKEGAREKRAGLGAIQVKSAAEQAAVWHGPTALLNAMPWQMQTRLLMLLQPL